ncbi:unnamed protein product [Pleuronectes platessa]|uniref:Uncharacterized protein n=1 Tax=Pleuronectes platessa TaxID=8262 RepID=A0A9N7V9S7_PLEPL|nr:unnamed protein product [Pleuronectes platessa]
MPRRPSAVWRRRNPGSHDQEARWRRCRDGGLGHQRGQRARAGAHVGPHRVRGEGLLPMADGLMRRYRAGGKAPPQVLYVDRDCCFIAGRCKTAQMFGEWDQLVVRLDVWHLMRPDIPALDADDVTRLQEARQSPLDPTSRELARHCRLGELRERPYARPGQVRQIGGLWQKLSDRDKALISFPPRH